MSRMKDHLMEIEDNVIYAWRSGIRNEDSIVRYVKEKMNASEADIHATIKDIFDLVDFIGSLHATSH